METSLLQKIKDWCSKNIPLIIAVVLIIGCVIFISAREGVIKQQVKKITSLESQINSIEQDREYLQKELQDLNLKFNNIQASNDSMKLSLKLMKSQMRQMEEKHKKEIDSLLNVPDDTVYVRSGVLFPNFDGGPLIYPYSGSQIRQIYTTGLAYPRLQQEFVLQGSALKTCSDLNTGYEAGIKNLKAQIGNLEKNIGLCEKQKDLYLTEVVTLKNTIQRKGFWNRVLVTSNLIVGALAVFK